MPVLVGWLSCVLSPRRPTRVRRPRTSRRDCVRCCRYPEPMPPRPPSVLTGRTPTIKDLLAQGGHSFSFEFFPPKTEDGERSLFQTIRQLEQLRPTFVSMTYGAGGSTRDTTVRMTERIATET